MSQEIEFENRPKVVAGKTVERWFMVGSGPHDPFWPTLAGAKKWAEDYELDESVE